MYGVLGALLRHMAGCAIRGRDVRMGRRLNGRVTTEALRAIPRHGIRPARDIVRIVAGVARQLSAAVAEARRLAKAVRLVDDLEAIAAFLGVEVNDVGAEGLPRAKGEYAAIEAADHLRQFDACGFQVTLHADVHLKCR